MPFCIHCGLEYQQPANFCNRCGRALPVAAVREAVRESPVAAATPLELPYYLSLNRIFFMTALTFGFYLFYWFYLTWQQYRDYTGKEAYPVWHALTLVVPIYNLFRTHAHARTYRALMWEYELPSSIRPGWAWVLAFIALFASDLSFRGILVYLWGLTPLTLGAVVFLLIIALISIAMIAILLVHLQSNLNRYWQSLPNVQVTSARVGVGEIIFGIVGALIWLSVLVNIFS